ncbi:NAD(P)-binding protein [Aspergillus costaricaensis CBS 115574]|uniref:NAD(P)-binding protein n=1 Tax=Aspergillus costaricaensis CBS 115574 TaxID=1448317 RepID=A0ACD1ITV7_9EURO|nr:NAD(P)-binding protein [Aspergillus costaricaensis CBS 115574]RAK93775.1 NAD(P)-binding protein [Aspergillus costaricaensis CBS 115574]
MPLYQPAGLNAPVLSQFSLQGKTAAVTGGARGIGLEIVRALAEAGADVALIYASSPEDEVRSAASQISACTGQRVTVFQSDVTSRTRIADTLEQIASAHENGRLDIVVANAGICSNIASLEYDESSWQRDNAVNYDGVMWTAQAAGKIFKRQGTGNLIITASVSSILVNMPQTQAAYNASKAAVVHLAKSLAVEWVDFARVNCISPGFIMTEMITQQPKERVQKWMAMIPGGRICDAAELKGAYVFLASDCSSYMTGANLVIDGGYTLT